MYNLFSILDGFISPRSNPTFTKALTQGLLENGVMKYIPFYIIGTKDESKQIFLIAKGIESDYLADDRDRISYVSYNKSWEHKDVWEDRLHSFLFSTLDSIDLYEVAKEILHQYKQQKKNSKTSGKTKLLKVS